MTSYSITKTCEAASSTTVISAPPASASSPPKASRHPTSQPVPAGGECGAWSAMCRGSRLLPYAAYRAMRGRVVARPGSRAVPSGAVVEDGDVTSVVILGGGPGGYEAALVAAQLGADVTLVDRDGAGGSAVLTDCVPSKTLVATAEVMSTVAEAAELGVRLGGRGPDEARHADGDLALSADMTVVDKRVLGLAAAQSADIQVRRRGVPGCAGSRASAGSRPGAP